MPSMKRLDQARLSAPFRAICRSYFPLIPQMLADSKNPERLYGCTITPLKRPYRYPHPTVLLCAVLCDALCLEKHGAGLMRAE